LNFCYNDVFVLPDAQVPSLSIDEIYPKHEEQRQQHQQQQQQQPSQQQQQ
jgi:hypothetical protein